MNWVKWLFVALFIAGACSSVASVGKDREPETHGGAVASVLMSAVLIWGLLMAWP